MDLAPRSAGSKDFEVEGMGVSSGRVRVADLSFQVFGRALHPDWFAVRAHRRYSKGAWEADVRIIEGGHAIIWSCGSVRLCEVLAGPEIQLPEVGRLYQSTVRHERSAALRLGEMTEYQTCFDVERIDQEVFTHLNDELTLDAAKGGLFYRYRPTNRLAPTPISHLLVEAKPRGVLVQAFHTFPDERAIVRSQTLIEVRSGKPA
jgi:hypothetical protein